jgi:hypothetical protein
MLLTMRDRLEELSRKWKLRAKRAFTDADGETDASGKRLIEHGAMCTFNCFRELEETLQEDAAALPASETRPA